MQCNAARFPQKPCSLLYVPPAPGNTCTDPSPGNTQVVIHHRSKAGFVPPRYPPPRPDARSSAILLQCASPPAPVPPPTNAPLPPPPPPPAPMIVLRLRPIPMAASSTSIARSRPHSPPPPPPTPLAPAPIPIPIPIPIPLQQHSHRHTCGHLPSHALAPPTQQGYPSRRPQYTQLQKQHKRPAVAPPNTNTGSREA